MSDKVDNNSVDLEDRLLDLLYGGNEDLSELDDERDESGAKLSDSEESELSEFQGLRALFAEMPEEEPPEAVTNKLLAMAAEHAPSPKSEGFFERLTAWFQPMWSHPGLAAAASLVVVVGVAGALYVRGDTKAVEPQVKSRELAPSSVAAERPSTGEEVASPAPQQKSELAQGTEEEHVIGGLALDEADLKSEQPSEIAVGEANATGRASEGEASGARANVRGASSGGAIGDGLGIGKSADKFDRAESRKGQAKNNVPAPAKKAKPKSSSYGGYSDEKAPKAEVSEDEVFEDRGSDRKPLEAKAFKEKSPAEQESTAKDEDKASPPAPSDQNKPSSYLLSMHRAAQQSAKKKNCSEVNKIVSKIRKADPAYYRDKVAKDSSLRCSTKSKKK